MLIIEATLSEIYPKYYEKDFSEEDFRNIVAADPSYNPDKPEKIGKYGKWLLNMVKTEKLKLEDLYKATDDLKLFIKFNNKVPNKDINSYKTPEELYDAVKSFNIYDENDSNTAIAKKQKEGGKHVYEDDKWLIIIPTTYESSLYYGKGTRWCTASNKSDVR